MEKYECWQTGDHPVPFDSKVYYPSFCLGKVYSVFNEFRLMERFIDKGADGTLLEVGCAGGELYRYFKNVYPRLKYTGSDVSKTAVEMAKKKYPEGRFIARDPDLSALKEVKPDHLFSRDVVLHQDKPFEFLGKLCALPSKGLFVRLRTRDKGPTENDVEKSCQHYLGSWIPYMIMNCDELTDYIRSLGVASEIHMVKNYMVLGGRNNRYLSKDCYLESTGTAETALYIKIGKSAEPAISVTSAKEDAPIPITDRIFYKFLKHVIKPGFDARVWW